MTSSVTREQVLAYRARVQHLDEKLPSGSFARAAWCGLQDTVPRSGVVSLHARVRDTRPDSWGDPSLVQIWFRGGADYIVPRADVGIFTLGSLPRDPEKVKALEKLADDVHRVTQGETMFVRDVQKLLDLEHPTFIRVVAMTGRAHIRWNASNIWLIPAARPDIDPEDARRELARRFLHWFAPMTKDRLRWWTGVSQGDATKTWKAIEPELVDVDLDGTTRSMLESDVDAMRKAEPIEGVRLLPLDDGFTKLDQSLLVPDEELIGRVFPPPKKSLGYAPGALLVDGQVVGAWQRQLRRTTIHPWARLPKQVRDAVEAEALSFPIAAKGDATVVWDSGAEAGLLAKDL